ncbi:hypothetical protein B0H34DRAFT_535684 [Crassisporium funariophilum]|nr:hypothetical protein B0H34DRAFT_535684 [Crassisporium funariophilum]
MSETTSSPYVHLHPISPSSSLSSTDSAPQSEPTSDEQPDLGAFTTVLRAWTHLQPPPRIPVQIHPATSSTTTTFQPDQSVIDSDFPSRSGRSRNSRISNRSAGSILSSFTRPPSSSVHPEGSTVWNHAPIAWYLQSGTPSNDRISDEDENEIAIYNDADNDLLMPGEYTPSPPNSLASTEGARTVEIASELDFPSFDDDSQDSSLEPSDSSVYPYIVDPDVAVPVSLHDDSQRLDSRETAHEDEGEEVGLQAVEEDYADDSSLTSMDNMIPRSRLLAPAPPSTLTQSRSQSQTQSAVTSVQLQSQACAPTTSANSSSPSLLVHSTSESPALAALPSLSLPSVSNHSLSPSSNNNPSISNSSPSTSTLITNIQNRNRNLLPPRTISDSSVATTGSGSSSLSLLSYQIPETPPLSGQEQPDHDLDLGMPRPQRQSQGEFATSTSSNPRAAAIPSEASGSACGSATESRSISLKTQESLHTGSTSISNSNSDSTTTFHDQRQAQQRNVYVTPDNSVSSVSISLSEARLPNPHSPLPTIQPQLEPESSTHVGNTRQLRNPKPSRLGLGVLSMRGKQGMFVVDDMRTPDLMTPSETFPLDHARSFARTLNHKNSFRPVDDDEKDEQPLAGESRRYGPGFGFGYIGSAPTEAQTSKISVHTSGNDAPPVSVQRLTMSDSQAATQAESKLHLGPQNEDEDEDDYPYPNPYSHSQTPRYHEYEHTPKGVPPPSEHPVYHSRPQVQSTSDSTSKPQPSSLSQRHAFANQLQSQSRVPSTELEESSSGAELSPQIHTQSQHTAKYSFSQPPKHTSMSTDRDSHAARDQPRPSYSNAYQQTYRGNVHGKARADGYPHSLSNLHALPTSLISPDPQDIAALENEVNGVVGNGALGQPHIEPESPASDDDDSLASPTRGYANVQAQTQADEEGAEPSLGYLDEVLSFIAVERARWTAAREGVVSGSNVSGDARQSGARDFEEEGEGLEGGAEVEGETEWKHVIDTGIDTPKRKRRRKRPPRSHVSAQGSSNDVEALAGSTMVQMDEPVPPDNHGGPPTPSSSPRKKKRNRSASSARKSKNTSKGAEKEFLLPPPPSLHSTSSVGGEKEKAFVTILRRPPETESKASTSLSIKVDVFGTQGGGETLTPTNTGTASVQDMPINFTGKQGKRVGRREREREKLKRDLLQDRASGHEVEIHDSRVPAAAHESSHDEDDDNDEEGFEPEEDEEEGQGEGDDSSLGNLSILQPPRRTRDRSRRRKGIDLTYIHSLGAAGAYKSTPGSPRRRDFVGLADGEGGEEGEPANLSASSVKEESRGAYAEGSIDPTTVMTPGRKRTRTKRVRGLVRVKSVPDLKVATALENAKIDAAPESAKGPGGKQKKVKVKVGVEEAGDMLEMDRHQLQRFLSASSSSALGLLSQSENQPAPHSKRSRLIALAKKLRELFPEQREELGKVISRFETQGTAAGAKGKKPLAGDANGRGALTKIVPIPVPSPKRKRLRKKGNLKVENGGISGEGGEFDEEFADGGGTSQPGMNLSQEIEEEEEEDEELDPRGRPPRKGEVLIHIFIDHSNILIGLLSHLKRTPSSRIGQRGAGRGRPLPSILTKATTTISTSNITTPASAFAAVKSTNTRPLPKPAAADGKAATNTTLKRPQPKPVPTPGGHPIPLPSFATMSRSLPTGSVLSAYMGAKDKGRMDEAERRRGDKEANSDGDEYTEFVDEDADDVGQGLFSPGSWKRGKDKEKKVPRHLWHAALALILERGRAAVWL